MESLEELKSRIEALRNLFEDLRPLEDKDAPHDPTTQISTQMSDEVTDSNPYRSV